MITFQPVKSEPTRSEVRLLKFGQVYMPSSVLVGPGQETTIWGNIHSNVTSELTGIVEVLDELSERSGLLRCATYCVGGKRIDVLVRVMNVCTEPVITHKGQSWRNLLKQLRWMGWIEDQLERVPIFTTQWLT